jgi:KDO2-lipid IV(A) lauroyltransferase
VAPTPAEPAAPSPPATLLAALSAAARSAFASVRRHDAVFWRRLAFAGTAHSPEWWRRYSPPVFGAGFYAFMGRTRAMVTANQARLLGVPVHSRAARRAARAMFVQYAQCLTDTLEAAGRPERVFAHEVRGAEHFFDARRDERGVIFVTAHTGSWEIGGRLLQLDRAVKVCLVMAHEPDERARAYVESLRQRAGVDVVYASGHDPATATTLLARLRDRNAVAIQLDRPPPPGAPMLATTLCGGPWAVPAGPFRLAQATRAPVIPVFLHRAGYRRYTLTLEPPIRVGTGRDPAVLREAAQQATAALERFVRAHPDQWFHFAPMPAA